MKLTKEDRKAIIELICDKQTQIIVKDHSKYNSSKYKYLEALKIRVKDM